MPWFLPAFAGGTGDLKLTTAFGVRGAFNLNWNSDVVNQLVW